MKHDSNIYLDNLKFKVALKFIESGKNQVELLRKYNIKGSSNFKYYHSEFLNK